VSPPPSCPHHVIDAAGELAGWCETEDGARGTAAEWNDRGIAGAPFVYSSRSSAPKSSGSPISP
jgi:hypothetical protein